MDFSKKANKPAQAARPKVKRSTPSVLQYCFQNKKKVATIFAALLFVLVLVLYLTGVAQGLDASISEFVKNAKPTEYSAFLNVFFKALSAYMNPYYLGVVLFVIAAFGPRNHPAFSGFLNVLGVFVVNEVFKTIISRDRPIGASEASYSFPSGHSVLAMAFFGFIIWLLWRSMRDRKYWRWCLTVLFAALIALVGVSRVYLGAHYVSDVIAGWCLGFVWLSFFTTVCAPRLMEAPLILGATELSDFDSDPSGHQSFAESLEWRRQKKILRKLGVTDASGKSGAESGVSTSAAPKPGAPTSAAPKPGALATDTPKPGSPFTNAPKNNAPKGDVPQK